jgi:hypothetical protein
MLTQTQDGGFGIDFDDADTRKRMARMVLRLFDFWGLNNQQRLELLGMSESSRSQLPKFSRGEASLAKGRDTMDRVGYLLSIYKALELLYPYDEDIRDHWVTQRHAMLDNLRPIDVMVEQGMIGLAKVARFLDAQRGL